jgi:molybdopterin-containing oxidoreductase family membrane subunit
MNEKTNVWLKVLWVVAGIGFLVGLYGLYVRFAFGHMRTDYGSYVPWGLWVAAYATFIGISAGAYVLASTIFILRRKDWYPIARAALGVALAAFIGGMIAIFLDLGHPERFYELIFRTNFRSMMGLMAWLYSLYGIMLLLLIWLSWTREDNPWLRRLGYLSVPYAILFAGAEGALFGVVGARPLWESGLTPIMFLVEAAVSGIAAVAVVAYILGYLDKAKAAFLGRAMLIVLLINVLLMWADFSTALYAGIPAKADAIRSVLFGDFWWVFWIVYMLIGVVIPLLLLAFRPKSVGAISLAGLLIMVTAVATKLSLVIPAQTQAELTGLERAFTGPGLKFEYFPTPSEWLLYVWIVSAAVLIFLAGFVLLQRVHKEAN